MKRTIDKTVTIEDRSYRLIDEQAYLSMRSALRQIDAAGVLGPLQHCDIQAIKAVAHHALAVLEERSKES